MAMIPAAALAGPPLGTASPGAPLIVALEATPPPPGEDLYLDLQVARPDTRAAHAPTIRVTLLTTPSPEPDSPPVLGALSVFPWPFTEDRSLRASFNLSRAVRRQALRLAVEPASLYPSLRVAIDIVPDPRDTAPVRVVVERVHLKRGSAPGAPQPQHRHNQRDER